MSQLWIIGDNASTEKPSPLELASEIRGTGAAPVVVSAPSQPVEMEVSVFPNSEPDAVASRLERIVRRLPIGYLTLIVKETAERRIRKRQ